jgi:hypothetical protein
MMLLRCFLSLCFICAFVPCSSYPNELGCSSMYAGSSTGSRHGGAVGTTSDSNLIVSETSNGNALTRTEYMPGETLYVRMESMPSQYSIEITGGALFDSGSRRCSNARKDNGVSIILALSLPTSFLFDL